MAGGLAALLDDVAAIAKLAAASVDDIGAAATKASLKATGVVVDDTAVTPRYVEGLTPDRELPIIKRIAMGSIRNKMVIILPIALLLSAFAPWLLTPILMLGGCYLSYEGAHKIWGMLLGHHEEAGDVPVAASGKEQEDKMVSSAITTDLILSAEIMVISLNEVADESFWMRAAALVAVAFLITALVYGVVALIVKLDDIGLHMTQRGLRSGQLVVKAMPVILSILSTVGLAAMLWVGGHILMVGADELGLHWPYEFVHHLQHQVEHAVPHALAGTLGWLTNTIGSAIIGLVVGSVLVAIMALLPFGHGKGHGEEHADGHGAHGSALEVHSDTQRARAAHLAAKHQAAEQKLASGKRHAAGEFWGEGTVDVDRPDPADRHYR
ncbi:DUF808 domain-containing protein [Luteococcus peritonei]|uniref:DUF808 domain-containing protein n=1 Tax=Luteococcus peritonei TaxID=88874 RepID=A0ABW4RRW7_9ACTN